MSGSILPLLLGLILLAVAGLMLQHANSQAGARGRSATRKNHKPEPARAEFGAEAEGESDAEAVPETEAPGAEAGPGELDREEAEEPEEAQAGEEGVAEPAAEPAGESQEAQQGEPGRPETEQPEPEQGEPAQPEQRESSGLFFSVRRRRRQWAAQHGAEYTREDIDLPQQWPLAALRALEISPIRAVAKDVVSGFWEGHEFHVADLGSGSLIAVRRAAESPVTVHYSRSHGMSEGLRRSELLDQPPFVAYTSSVRSLDRMLDVRVEDGLAALSQTAADVIWGGEWVLITISRRLDCSVWGQLLTRLVSLAHAAMVLPPRKMSIPLELDNADSTRPLPGLAMDIKAGLVSETPAPEPTPQRPGYLRAVGDSSTENAAESGESEIAEATTDEPPSEVFAGVEEGGEQATGRPYMERPAEPVEFPSRYDRSRAGNASAEDFADSTLDNESQDIPLLGEDPEHISGSVGQRPQVIRAEIDHESSIFGDELSATAAQRRGLRKRSGRHRAPDVRHALPSPIEPVEAEIELVEAEIVEEEEQD